MPRAVTIRRGSSGWSSIFDAQAADVGVDEAGVAEVLVAPHPFEELVARQHGADVVGELAHQAELGLGQAELLAGLEHDPLLAAKLDVAETGRPWRCRTTPGGAPAAAAPGSGPPAPSARPAW